MDQIIFIGWIGFALFVGYAVYDYVCRAKKWYSVRVVLFVSICALFSCYSLNKPSNGFSYINSFPTQSSYSA